MNGVNETNKSNEMITADRIEAVKQEGRSLVRECIKERSRFSRVFETKNGEKAAVIYPKAVHFKKDDAWEAIDNTLVLSKDQLAYENAQGRMKVRIARMPKQTDHKKNVVLLNLEEQQNARSALQDQTEEKSEIIELASVEKDGFMISWGLKTQGEKPVMFSQVNESEVTAVPVEFKPNLVRQQTVEEKLLKLSAVIRDDFFREILPGMDIRYRLESEVMKEEIILKKKEAATETITFVMKHPGLSMHVLADGSVALCKMFAQEAKDTAEISDEKLLYYFGCTNLFDKNGEILKAAYQIEKGQGISEITIKMDASWLMDEGRAYPGYEAIRSSSMEGKKQTTIDDAFVRSKDPSSSYGYNFSELEVGKNRPYEICRTFLKFNTSPRKGFSHTVDASTLNLYQYRFSADNGQGFRVSAHEVTGSWEQRTLTWNNQPKFKPEALDYLTLENTNGMAVPKTFDVTKLIRGWYNNPSSNHGIALKAVNENVYATATLVSSDMPVNKYGLTADCYPIGIVYYRSTKGLEDYYSYHEQELGRTGSGYVNRYNGNLVFIHEDEGTSGILMPVSVSHVYNLSDYDTKSRFGKGFRLSLMQELKASGNSDYPYVLTDTDGTNHYFYKDTSDSNGPGDEDGLGLVITQTSSSEYDSYRIMKDKDEVQYVFGQDGYLRQIKDTYGNAMKCQYGPNSAENYIQYAEDPTGARVVFNYNSDLTKLVSITAIREILLRMMPPVI